MDLGLRGRIALVTGAGGGIGAGIAATLVEEACVVYIADSNREAATRTRSIASCASAGAWISS